MAATMDPQAPSQVSSQERFFRFFQHEVTSLQEQMQNLQGTGTSGGERADGVDHVLAGIARLSNEVKDAASYLPAYDQRTYSDAIKALSDKLQSIRSSFAPRQKFSFKAGFTKKNSSAISVNEAAELASQHRSRLPGWSTDVSSADSSFAPTPAELVSPAPEMIEEEQPDNRDTMLGPQAAAVRKPSFSQATSITISNHHGVHIILPSSASHATTSGTVSNLRGCVVDMSVPTASAQPFAGLILKNIKDSLIICGHVSGPVHITNVSNSIIVVACRQFRMHESKSVDIYLHCGSRPIIEACKDIKFAPLPKTYITEADTQTQNHFDQVDDFKWLKSEPSPNWAILDSSQQIREEVWRDTVPGGVGLGPVDILRAVKLTNT